MAKNYKKRHRQYLLRKDMRKSRRGIIRAVFATVSAFVFLLLWNFLGTYFDTKQQGFIYGYFSSERTPPEEILIISIDDESYKELGLSPRQPFSRAAFAKALKRAHELGPKLAILDLYMAPESQDPEANRLLAEALAAGLSTIGYADVYQELSEEQIEQVRLREKDPIDFSGVRIDSDPMFVEAAATQVKMAFRFQGGFVQNISAGRVLNEERARLTSAEGDSKEAVESIHRRIPLTRPLEELANLELSIPGERDLIHFYGPPGSIPSVSLFQFMPGYEGKVPEVKDKVLFLGFQSFLKERGQAVKDQFPTPVSSREMYGVEVHATIAANLLDGTFIRRFQREGGFLSNEYNLLFIIVFIASYVTALFRPIGAVLVSGISFCIWMGTSAYLFNSAFIFLPGALLYLLLSPFIVAASAIVAWLQVERSLSTAEKRLGKDLRAES